MPRFDLRETVQVDFGDGIYTGVIDATEPGTNLYRSIEGIAYHVRLPGHDSLPSRVVIVGEWQLTKLIEG